MFVSLQSSLRTYIRRRMFNIKVFMALFFMGGILCLAVPLQPTHAFEDSVTAEADTFIDGNEPNKSFGDVPFINVKDNPPAAAFVRFEVSGAAQSGPSNTHLQLFVLSSKTNAPVQFYVFRVSSTWDEHRLTWNQQPAFGDQVGASSAAPVRAGELVDINLGSAVDGDGTYSFAITSNASDVVSFAAHTEPNAARLIFSPQEFPTETTSAFMKEKTLPESEATETPVEETATEAPTESVTDATLFPDETETSIPTSLAVMPTEEPIGTLTSDDTPDENPIALTATPTLSRYVVYMPVVRNS